MTINARQFRDLIIKPSLKPLGLWSQSAENLLFGTAAQESHCGTYVKQIKGPALGIYQMEPATYRDVSNYLYTRRNKTCKDILTLLNKTVLPNAEDLVFDLRLATIMTRIHYARLPSPLPEADDIQELANYWKKYYNTPQGKGTPEEFSANYMRFSEKL